MLKRRFGRPQLIVDAHYRSLSHLPPGKNHIAQLRHCYDTIEHHLKSLQAIGENIEHRHFVSVIPEKLPQKVKYQLYKQKSEDEEWTVTKLRVLLGRHISAMEMAESEEVPASSNSNRERSERSYENLRNQHLKSTAGGLLAGTSWEFTERFSIPPSKMLLL